MRSSPLVLAGPAGGATPGPSPAVVRALKRHLRRAPLSVYRAGDPVERCHRYRDPRDQEVVALVAALLAFGRVSSFLPRLDALLGCLGRHPRRYVDDFDPRRDRAFFSSFRLRLWTGQDIRYLLANLKQLFRNFRTLEDAFLRPTGQAPPFRQIAATTAGVSLHRRRIAGLASQLSLVHPRPWTGRPTRPRYYQNLVVDPLRGSACKRWNLFLRWVVRPADGVDLGLWKRVSTRDLVIPLDVHVGRISRLIGLRRRLTLDWKAAEEVTGALARVDPDDPVRFDLALSHLGISGGCRGRYVAAVCGTCGIRKLCSAYP